MKYNIRCILCVFHSSSLFTSLISAEI